MEVTEAMIDHMARRFLAWKLPEHFNPDAGISFEPEFNKEYNAARGTPPQLHQPTGTNLFDYEQAKAMVQHMVEGLPAMRALEPRAASDDVVGRLKETRFKLPEGFYSDADYGCNEDDPHSLICAILDSGPEGTKVMQELTATGYSVVETEALDAALAALQPQPEVRCTDPACDGLGDAHYHAPPSNEARLREVLADAKRAMHSVAERMRDINVCDCFAHSSSECVCGAWDDAKAAYLASELEQSADELAALSNEGNG